MLIWFAIYTFLIGLGPIAFVGESYTPSPDQTGIQEALVLGTLAELALDHPDVATLNVVIMTGRVPVSGPDGTTRWLCGGHNGRLDRIRLSIDLRCWPYKNLIRNTAHEAYHHFDHQDDGIMNGSYGREGFMDKEDAAVLFAATWLE